MLNTRHGITLGSFMSLAWALGCSPNPAEAPQDASMDATSVDVPTMRRDDELVALSDASDVLAANDVAAGPTITWHQQIRPIIASRCVNCHATGLVGPFPLETLAQVRMYSRAIVPAIESRQMPPWMPLQGCQDFKHNRSLTDGEIYTIAQWVRTGMAEGDAANATPVPPPEVVPFRPDMRLPMLGPVVPDFSHSTTGADDYHCFVLNRSLDRTIWVTGYDIEPGVRAMVHHANVYAVPAADAAMLNASPQGFQCFGGINNSRTIGVWVPGTPPAKYPDNTGIQIARGEAIVVQMHYYRFNRDGGMPPADQSTMLLELAPVQPSRLGQLVGPGGGGDFVVPARTNGFAVSGEWVVPARGTLWGVLPHMHKIGKRIEVRIGDSCAVDVPSWDFHWQQAYFYTQLGGIPVPAGTRTSITCIYDNPNNTPVRQGQGSDEEMCGAPFYYTAE